MDKNLSKNIFLRLLNAKNEEEITQILESKDYFKNRENWIPLNRQDNNKGYVDSQGKNPIRALVEKITNSIDAIILKKALEIFKINNISELKYEQTPKTINDALKKFFNIDDGRLDSLTEDQKDKLASQIYLVVENLSEKRGNVYIFDKGEGQKPDDFEKTFLKFGGNKQKIQFVHGRFGIGSFGVLKNCGDKGYQLLLSKNFRDDFWGWTIIREYLPEDPNYKQGFYEYFTFDKKIPRFTDNDFFDELLQAIPYDKLDFANFSYGTLIKLFNYNLRKITNVDIDLNREINRYLPKPALPYRILSVKNGRVESHVGPGKEVFGNFYRLEEWAKKGDIKKHSLIMNLPYLGDVKTDIFLSEFREENNKKKESLIDQENVSTRDEAIFFIRNGQSHGEFSRYFLENELNLNYIYKDLVIYIDCSNSPPALFDKIFNPTRDSLEQIQEEMTLKKD